MGKQLSEKLFQINEHLTVSCRSESTSYGFRHLASLHVDGWVQKEAKETYYNRTWERYEFQTVIRTLGAKVGGENGKIIQEFAKNYQEDNSAFRTIAAVAALGDIMTGSKSESNDWKVRMIKAGLGNAIDMPDDWETLTDEEKERRLNLVIQELKGPAGQTNEAESTPGGVA